jgi:hypothetical protein
MFCFGVMSIAFGLAFASPWKIIPPPPRGLVILDDWIPLEVWGHGWWIAGIFLVIGAFRQNQAWAMGAYAGMLSIWFLSYAATLITDLFTQGHSSMGYAVVVWGAFLGAVVGVARLVNAPPEAMPKMDKSPTGEIRVVGDDG